MHAVLRNGSSGRGQGRNGRFRARRGAAAFLLLSTLGLSGCDGSGSGSGAGAGSAIRSGAPGEAYTVDLDAIFPAGAGRGILLNNCQSCHTWVPVVVLQMNEEEWARSSREHRPRVEALSDEDFATLYAYLSSTFTPERPVPELPPALLESWTTY
jgi:mono/diheme cytochrome c family protein